MTADRKYAFSWQLLGDPSLGRPHLGLHTRIEVYRLMQFCFRDVMEQEVGTARCEEMLFAAGKLAGMELYRHLVPPTDSFNAFIIQLQNLLSELGVGILRVEEMDLAAGSFVLTVSEDLDCSGLPDTQEVVCTYDEGLIAGVLEAYTGQPFAVKEVDCWCTGDRTCRFTARRLSRDEDAA